MDCCDHCHVADPHRGNTGYRRVLWAVLAINAAMFLVEIGAGVAAGSASLQADALDFFGDAANYAISLLVVGMVLRYRALTALAKGTTMGLFGLWIIGTAIWHALHGTLPNAYTMGAIGFAALAANAIRPCGSACGVMIIRPASPRWQLSLWSAGFPQHRRFIARPFMPINDGEQAA